MSEFKPEQYSAVPTQPPPPYPDIDPSNPAEQVTVVTPLELESQAPPRRSVSRRDQALSVMSEKRILICIAVAVGVVGILLTILLPISFATLDYNEYGFRRRKSSGTVDTSKVYSSGRHLVGPDTEFKVFPADAHFVEFQHVTVFTSDKLQVSISARFQYFLRPHQLHFLHKNYDIHYKDVLKNNALDAMKGKATLFSTREYIRERMRIERELYNALRDRLGGTCCEKDCQQKNNCVPNCKAYHQCSEEDFGLFTEVRYFQLAALDIPDDLAERYLRALVLQEENLAEKHRQDAQVVRKQTESMVKEIENLALEISRQAESESSLIRSKSEANSTAIVERARTEGLKNLYEELGITDNKHKLSFDYIRTLGKKEDVSFAIDFNQLIAGPLTGK